MITGKENVLKWFDDSDRKMWKLYRGSDMIAEGISDVENANRERLEFMLDLVGAGKYRLQVMPSLEPKDTSRHLKMEIVVGGSGQQMGGFGQFGGGINGIGDIDRLVESRMGALMTDKIRIMELNNQVENLKRDMREREGLGEVTPYQRWIMEVGTNLIPLVPAIISGLTGKTVEPIKPLQPAPVANPQPRQGTPVENNDQSEERARFSAAINKMAEASPNWLESLEIVAEKYSQKPKELESYLPMLKNM